MTIKWGRIKPHHEGIYTGAVEHYLTIERISDVSSSSPKWELRARKIYNSLKKAKEAAERLS